MEFRADCHLYGSRHVPYRQSLDFFGAGGKNAAVFTAGALGGGLDQLNSDKNVDGEVLLRLKFLYDVAAPGQEPVRPGLEGIKVTTLLFDLEL